MSYQSPFEALSDYYEHIESDYSNSDPLVAWDFLSLIENTKNIIDTIQLQSLDHLTLNELIQLVYNPTAIFSWLTNLIIANIWKDPKFLNELIRLKRTFSDIAPKIYSASESVIDDLESFESDILNTKKDILSEWGWYLYDSKSFPSSNFNLSKRTSSKILSILNSSWGVFLALWNWGVAPGIDVYNRVKEETNEEIIFRVARLSMDKLWDERPRLSRKELNEIKLESEDKNLIIFDEDSCTWRTMNVATRYFDTKISLFTDMYWISNDWEFKTDNFNQPVYY